MIRQFRALQSGGIPRPIIDVDIEGIPEAPVPCLIDTGSLHNRFGLWIAKAAGISLRKAAEETIVIGGVRLVSRTASVRLSLNGTTWEAPAAFCDPWPWDISLLGQEGFLRWFDVTFYTADRRLTIT